MMDFADLYLQHNHLGAGASAAGMGKRAPAAGQGIHELVGGALSAQEYSDRLEALEQRVGTFEEKLMNLTRLIKLSQGLQAEKEAEMRKENDELRARLQRQEHVTAQLLRDVAGVKEHCATKAPADAVALVEKNLQALAEATKAAERRLAAMETQQHESDHALAAELDETKLWARRNLQRLKDHVDMLANGLAEVRGGHGDLTSRVETLDCRAELEYKKLRLLLQQKGTEAEALAALIDKELRNVRQVAQRHEVLGSPEVNPATVNTLANSAVTPPSKAADFAALKFRR